MGSLKPHVERLDIYLPHQQRILFNSTGNAVQDATQKKNILENNKLRRTLLTEFFKINRMTKEALDQRLLLLFKKPNRQSFAIQKNPLDYLYTEFPEHFIWIKRNKQWKIREKDKCVGRINFISSR